VSNILCNSLCLIIFIEIQAFYFIKHVGQLHLLGLYDGAVVDMFMVRKSLYTPGIWVRGIIISEYKGNVGSLAVNV